EFPGQTHIFYWRELHALRSLGVTPEIISTTEPPAAIMSHKWTEAARAATTYLAPRQKSDAPRIVASALSELALAGPSSLVRTLVSFARAEGLPPARHVRLLGLMLMGARLRRIARERGIEHVHAHSCADA